MDRNARWGGGWRDAAWQGLDRLWDLIVIGGGITGAGIAREAARIGLSVLLVDGHDFAWGTSSRSSKMVHGGLRYLANLQIRTTIDSIRERDRLLAGGSGLVEPLDFVFADFEGTGSAARKVRIGLWVYDKLAGARSAFPVARDEMLTMFPGLREAGLRGGQRYRDAETDDARLVLRVLREAARAGATILNYAEVRGLVRGGDGRVHGVVLDDHVGGRGAEPRARAVINAAGVWVDALRARLDRPPRMRPLRGSHLVFRPGSLPVDKVLLFPHPGDRRGLYIYPWEGATLVGTTDLDHRGDLAVEPRISDEEADYLMAAVDFAFGERGLGREDIVSTYAGIRPVIADAHGDPSKASRESAIWREEGLWTITGGKLTTFRSAAEGLLRALRRDIPEIPRGRAGGPIFDPLAADAGEALSRALGRSASPHQVLRLLGRHGVEATAMIDHARGVGGDHELARIDGTPTLWAELRWAAHAEGVVHLDDLLLRRTRIGNLLPGGAAEHLPAIRAIVQGELGWDDAAWAREEARYRELWAERYAPPALHP